MLNLKNISQKCSHGYCERHFNEDNLTSKIWKHQNSECQDLTVIKGAINQLRRWPSYLLIAFLTACLIITSVTLFIFISLAFTKPIVPMRLEDQIEDSNLMKFFFVTHENRSWSFEELCSIEIFSQQYSKFNVYLINLGELHRPCSSHKSIEKYIRSALESNLTNIHNIDITIKEFFHSSELKTVSSDLKDKTLLTAAKAYLLWVFSGITVEPNSYCYIKYIRQLFCDNNSNYCTRDEVVTIEPDNNILATGVKCQLFLGYLIREIFKFKENDNLLKNSLQKFCASRTNCSEVRIFSSKFSCSTAMNGCPIVQEYFQQNFGRL